MLRGILLLLGASFCFALTTVFVKLACVAPWDMHPLVTAFCRFLIGLVIFGGMMAGRGVSLKPRRPGLIFLRAAGNTLAVILFFVALKYTTVTKANLLNLTYPAFVFMIAPFITGERSAFMDIVFLFCALAGAWLIVAQGATMGLAAINRGDMIALASGVVSAFAISILRQARKDDSANVILFYQMAFGTVATGILMLPHWHAPAGRALFYMACAGLLAAAGQAAITVGYRYVNAAIGAVVLGSGVLFAAFLGITFLGEPFTGYIAAGGALILVSLIGISGIMRHAARLKTFFE